MTTRTKSTWLNVLGGLAVKGSGFLTAFITRTTFLYILGIEYAGVASVFTNVLTVLSFAELGIGTAITYALYKPIAENDNAQICKLMNAYRKIYATIGIVIFMIGLCLIPFLKYVIKETPNINEDLRMVYLLYLLNTAVSYFLIYKSTFLTAIQKDYLVSKYKVSISIAKTVIECVSLVIFRNFLIYLVVSMIGTFVQNVVIAKTAEREYPVLKQRTKARLESAERKRLFNDTRALALYKVSGTVLNGTDSILVSSFFGTASAGILGNYSLIINQVYSFVMLAFTATSASVGNLAATSDNQHQYSVFRRMLFISFWIYCFCTTSLWTLLNPFMHVWQSGQHMFSDAIVALMVIEFYFRGMMSPITQFRTSNGLFVHGKYRPLIMAIMNIVISVLLAEKMGIAGILLGTIISRVATQIWYDPWLIFKYVFQISIFRYIKDYVLYGVITLLCCYVTNAILQAFCLEEGIMKVLSGCVLCVLVPNVVVVAAFHRSEPFKATMCLFRNMIGK